MDLVWLSTGGLWLCGPETTAWTFELPSGVTAAGVRFRPGVAPVLWGLDGSRLLNHRVAWNVVAGRESSAMVGKALCAADDGTHRIEILENLVAGRFSVTGRDAVDVVAESVLAHIVADPHAGAADIADSCGLTTRQLLRRCQIAFGYGVSTLGRIVRFHRLWSLLDAAPGASLAGCAHDAGYADQAHLNRDCRAITGLSPRRFLAESHPTFPRMSDPYKTGVDFAATLR